METGLRVAVAVLVVSAFAISIYFRHRARRVGGALDRSQGTTTLVVLRLVGLIAFVPLILWLVHPQWARWAQVDLPTGLRWAAVMAAAALLPAFVWLFRTIGNNISPRETTRVGHALVTEGPYRYIRHPLYTFGAAFYALIAVATGLWWLFGLLAIAFVALAWRTPREEANLIALFGDDYRDYMATTGRYLPHLGNPGSRS